VKESSHDRCPEQPATRSWSVQLRARRPISRTVFRGQHLADSGGGGGGEVATVDAPDVNMEVFASNGITPARLAMSEALGTLCDGGSGKLRR
jgi:hypothetical protein